MQLDPSAFVADPELIRALQEHAAPMVCGEEKLLFHQGDPPTGLYILHNGNATISMDSGHDSILFRCTASAGSLLGLPGLIANQPYSLTAVAHAGASVGFISKDKFNQLMQSQSLLMVKILQVLAAEVRSARLAITHS